jgi:hypothetical protein
MHMKIARKFAQTVPLAVVALVTTAAMATQTVTPYTAASGGSSIAAANVPAGTTFTFFGRYEVLTGSTGNESGLGLKVKYDKTKFSSVVVDQVYTKCMIATPDQQEAVPATSKVVFGWIDTSVRRTTGTPNGVVGWPATADPAAPGATDGCLNPGGIVVDQAGVAPPLSLFRMQMTTVPGFTSGTTNVDLVSEGNFSYAGATPGFTDKSIVLTAAAAPACNLDVDGSGTRQALVDGVLLVRSMLGVTGAAYTAGITLPGSATRTTEATIKAFIALNNYDIDGSGTQQALVDGVILTRLMLGIPDATLLTGVTLPGAATFTTAAAIRANVNSKCGTSF